MHRDRAALYSSRIFFRCWFCFFNLLINRSSSTCAFYRRIRSSTSFVGSILARILLFLDVSNSSH
jgi:hypothetical protein